MTLSKLNKALENAGYDGCVSKAGGVYYLAGKDFAMYSDSCLHCVRLSQMTVDFVLAEAARLSLWML